MVGLVLDFGFWILDFGFGFGFGWGERGWVDGWMEDRKEGTRLRWNGIRLQLWSHFWIVRVMHALDVFRNYHVYIHTLKEEVVGIHPS